ncbi:MAG: isoprenylcysteine carboxylmethyltransferase family protein [Pseudomonadota bacterium]
MQNKIPPPVWMLLFGVAMWFVADSRYAYPFELPNRWVVIGILVAFGAFFSVTAVRQFGKAETTVNPLDPAKATTLVSDGIFAKSRNPMYVGLLLALGAWAIWLGSLASIAVALLFIPVLNHFQIKPEERVLRELFGDEYREYCRNVRRWI